MQTDHIITFVVLSGVVYTFIWMVLNENPVKRFMEWYKDGKNGVFGDDEDV